MTEKEQEEIKLFTVTIKLEDSNEWEAESEEEAEKMALESFLQSCNSPRWVKSNSEIECSED